MDSGFVIPAEVIDLDFAEEEARWSKAAEPYDNLSKLPPKQTNNYYVKKTKKGSECMRLASTYLDPWPVKQRKKAPPQEKHITAGIAAEDREAFAQELFNFAREHNLDGAMDISEVVAAKKQRIAEVQKAMLSGEGPAAAGSQSNPVPIQSPQPTPANPHNTRSRRGKNATATGNSKSAKSTAATKATENPEDSVLALGVANEESLRDTPPVMTHMLMRNTRELSADNARLNRPVRGVVPNSYYTSYAQSSSSRTTPAGDEPEEACPPADQQNAPTEAEPTRPKSVENMRKQDHDAESNSSTQGYPSKADGKKTALSTAKAPKTIIETKTRRAVKACNSCRKHKTRCNGGTPCEACERRNFTCTYEPGGNKKPGKRPRQPKPDSDDDEDTDNDTRPAKRARKQEEGPAVKAKESTKAKEPAESTENGALPSKPVCEESEQDETRLVKRQRPGHPQAKGHYEPADEAVADLHQPAKQDQATQKQPVKPQSSAQGQSKRAREDTEDIEARPAKQQRKDTHISWHMLYPAIDETVFNGEDGTFKAFSFEDQNLANKEELINSMEQEDAFHNRPSIKLVMPDLLKAILVDDWEHVTKDQQLVPIPHEHPVDEVLKEYLDEERFKREEGSTQMDILDETIAGLREYFDRALGRILLYR